MADHVNPRVLVSRCLGFDACRWNGVTISSPEVRALRPFVDFVDVCPEVEIGLGVPRDPVRIVERGGVPSLVQPATARDMTDDMNRYALALLRNLGPLDGIILKSRSPSCGLTDTKVYSTIDGSAPVSRTRGLFAVEVTQGYPGVPAEDEGRLTNFRIRERFLAAIFTLSSFRTARARALAPNATRHDSARLLTEFHASSKLLLMAQDQSEMRRLGRVAANAGAMAEEELWEEYRLGLLRAFSRAPRRGNALNVLEHALGYFKTQLSPAEKRLFLKTVDEYRAGRVPLSAPVAMLRAWIARFGEPYLASQSFFEPFPAELVSMRDSALGR
jgi:uncharacterized protein YbgA (DUF1722 family)/uncharacterized protein YbbK (DUF523 family)